MELLSPAGNIESLKIAVSAGADAVYLGLESFNARMKADNFSSDNIAQWTEYCHLRDVKVYVVLNTIIKNCEIEEITKILTKCNDAYVDAIILQDLAVLHQAKTYAPNCELHASTQMGIHNLPGAKFAEKLGFKRVIVARETTLDDIKAIKQHTSLEVEYFVHGALCVAFSGNCLMSSIATGNSGNRGQCLQFCRKEFQNSITNSKGYFLSPKDQNLIDKLHDLELCGVDSLKIEGRLRSPEYAYATVHCYSKVMRGEKLNNDDLYSLKCAFNRGGFTRGYCYDKTLDIMSPKIQGNFGCKIGHIVACDKSPNGLYLIKLHLDRPISNGMGCKIIEKNQEIGGFEIQLQNECTIISKLAFASGDVHITYDPSLLQNYVEKRVNIQIAAAARIGDNFKIRARVNNIVIEIVGEYIVAEAVNVAMSKEDFCNAINKFGNTPFGVISIDVECDTNAYVPKSVINNLRREVVQKMTDAIIANHRRSIPIKSLPNENDYDIISCKKYDVLVELEKDTLCQIDAKWLDKCGFILDISNVTAVMSLFSQYKANLFIKLPCIATKKDLLLIAEKLSKIDKSVGIYADNLYAVMLAIEDNRPCLPGFGLNISNSISKQFFGDNVCQSVELSAKEYLKDGIVYAYGKLPIMTFKHCPIQLITKCDCSCCRYRDFEYSDSYGSYAIRREKLSNCLFTMHNSCCHNLVGMAKDSTLYLDCIVENKNINNIIKAALSSEKITVSSSTKGHYSRGVK